MDSAWVSGTQNLGSIPSGATFHSTLVLSSRVFCALVELSLSPCRNQSLMLYCPDAVSYCSDTCMYCPPRMDVAMPELMFNQSPERKLGRQCGVGVPA